MNFQIGRTYGNYQFIDVLDSSRDGVTYKVKNRLANRMESMKVLPGNAHDDQDRVERFLREIRVHAGLMHPNIISFYNAAELESRLVMTSELVEGTTMAGRLELGRMRWQDAVRAMSQVLAALAYAHERCVVHRDLNPSRIVLTPEGEARLNGFTLAKVMADPNLTSVGSIVGSLKYISPEQVKGVEQVDGRSDIYSAGVVLYEALTGQPPFQAKSQFELMSAQVNLMPAPPSSVCSAVPKELDAVVMKAMAKDPAERYQTATIFRQVLEGMGGTTAPAAVAPVVAEAVVEVVTPVAAAVAPVEVEKPVVAEAAAEAVEPVAAAAVAAEVERPVVAEAAAEAVEPVAAAVAAVEVEKPVIAEAATEVAAAVAAEVEKPVGAETVAEVEPVAAAVAAVEVEKPVIAEAATEVAAAVTAEVEKPVVAEAAAEAVEPVAAAAVTAEVEKPVIAEAAADAAEPVAAVVAAVEVEKPVVAEAAAEAAEPVAAAVAAVEVEKPVVAEAVTEVAAVTAEVEKPAASEAVAEVITPVVAAGDPVEVEKPLVAEAAAEVVEPVVAAVAAEAVAELVAPAAAAVPAEVENPLTTVAVVEVAPVPAEAGRAFAAVAAATDAASPAAAAEPAKPADALPEPAATQSAHAQDPRPIPLPMPAPPPVPDARVGRPPSLAGLEAQMFEPAFAPLSSAPVWREMMLAVLFLFVLGIAVLFAFR